MDMAAGLSSFTATQNQPQPENAFDCFAPSFPASTSRKPSRDIFINHYGRDVKHTLASTINQKLHSMGFRVFLDKDALEAGDYFPAEIQHAIDSASLHIAIFSSNYPQSPWCLKELCSMHRTSTKIIPIFYHVNPCELRWIKEGKGWYAHVFSEHKKNGRYEPEQLEQWKEALYKCSFLHGHVVNNNEKDEATLLKNIVNDALKIKKKKGQLSVAEYPVALDELVQDFESQLVREGRAKFMGIWGMGGSGKTTLPKEIFNRKFSSFERCSFVSDVRDAASRSALPDKQKKLLKDLGGANFQFQDVVQGKSLLRHRLRSIKVLIVLDDVDHLDQLDALLPDRHSLRSQSRIIVTTRDHHVLELWGLSLSFIYRMPRLNPSHAEQLFCWHAFLQSSPPAQFQTLVNKFTEVCNGLPLSLKVFGAQVYGRKSQEYWKSQLHKLLRISPNDIEQKLQISFDALDEQEREIYLDVACFFIGEEKSRAIAAWDRLGWTGLQGFETLQNKGLVELVEGERIMMHDHLREMGREIATRHSPYRLWCAEKISKMKEHSTAEQLVQVMEESQVDLLGKGVATAESSGAGPSRTDGQRVEDFQGEITARDSIIVGLERDNDRLHAELNALQRQLAGMYRVCAKRKREMLRLQLDSDSKECLVQELQARVKKQRTESRRLCLDRDTAMKLLEGEGMGHAFTQLMDMATRMDRAHRESSYYRGLYERLVPIEQREPPFAEGSFACHQ